MSDRKLFNKDGLPLNWDGKYWHSYKDMMTMTILDIDEEMYDVMCGRIDQSYLATDAGKKKLVVMQRKIRKLIMMSLSRELAELYRTEPTGSAMWAALLQRFENRMNNVAIFHAVQRLVDELRHMRYNTNDDIEVHLRKMRNKELELADYGNKLPSRR